MGFVVGIVAVAFAVPAALIVLVAFAACRS
jgi:hypothetical protein